MNEEWLRIVALMEKRQQIFILGNSLILGALGECLGKGGRFDLTRMPQIPKAVELEPLNPDVILFDLESPHLESIFSLSAICSKLVLIGISPDTNLVKVWVGRQLQELSVQGLLAVIDDQLQSKPLAGLNEGGPKC
jgi:hypothetical protein